MAHVTDQLTLSQVHVRPTPTPTPIFRLRKQF